MQKRENATQKLTPLELQIMQVLWAQGPSTVQQVQEALDIEPPLAYTTVQTMLNILLNKKKTKRVRNGRAYIYAAHVSEETITTHAVRDLLKRVFGGSVESLVMSLVRTKSLDAKKLSELTKTVAEFEDKELNGADHD